MTNISSFFLVKTVTLYYTKENNLNRGTPKTPRRATTSLIRIHDINSIRQFTSHSQSLSARKLDGTDVKPDYLSLSQTINIHFYFYFK